MAERALSRAATLAFALAAQGALPIVELFGLAQELAASGAPAQAIALYRLWLKHTDTPLAYAGHFNLAVALMQEGELGAAEQAFRKAISLQPEFIEAHLQLGILYQRRAEDEQALAAWRRALELIHPAIPNSATLHVQILNHLGRLLEQRKRYGEAGRMYTRSLLLDPQQPAILPHWINLRLRQCEWPVYAPLPELDDAALEQGSSALATLSLSDDPDVQLAAAQRFCKGRVLDPASVTPLAPRHGYVHPRLRIGYLSADFCSHAVAILIAELFELHDRATVEVFGFCWSAEDGSPLRARLVGSMDQLVRIDQMNDQQAAQCIRSHEIDILIDLHGLTLGTRPDILSWRPAPVQLTWLGFPGTTGHPAIDYVLADEFVLPPSLAPFFSEQPLYLPDTFQINDRQRRIGARPSRASCGLPQDAFVFCCFNANHKITPDTFASWMCILQRVPGSVLWLIAGNEEVRNNLLGAAAAYGVPASRLYFAERALPADYLARYQVADLFLDTLPFNAGTTASDALWAGLPLLTRAGHCFAGRMAGSVLRAAGLPELITHSRREYEDMAVSLAQTPARLAELRQRLLENRDQCALFDTPRFVRNLEQACRRVAKGELRPELKRRKAQKRNKALPLVCLLLPVCGTRQLEATLRSALAQTYAHCDIIISDRGAGNTVAPKIATLLKRHHHVRYLRAPGLDARENIAHCLALANGPYLNYVMEGEVLHPEKIERMMQPYLLYPGVGLVTSFRQREDDTTGVGLFPVDTVITGQSMGDSILSGGCNLAGELSAMLLRRADVGPALGQYGARRYHALGEVATALAMLSGRDCVYLSSPLTRYPAPATAQLQQQQQDDPFGVRASMEWLRLMYEAQRQQHFLLERTLFRQLLAGRLQAFAGTLALNHAALRAAGCKLEDIHEVLRQGYQLLLGE
ncbi:tetratricopeptide repeat protein [Oxalobacteraceae bacterium]|nr:tetratricopeptide repeat protein [Oxalobacteraceae bacterium]